MKQKMMELSRNVEWTELSWLNHCRGEAVPYRSDFDAIDEDFQFVLEIGDDDRVRLRHVGLYIEALFGTALAGREFTTLFAEPHRRHCEHEVQSMFRKPSKIYLNCVSEAGDVQFGIFPLSADYGPVKYAVGAASLEQLPERNVPRIGIHQMECIRLVEEKTEAKYGFAEERSGFDGAPRGLKVIQGGGSKNAVARPGLRVIANVKREP